MLHPKAKATLLRYQRNEITEHYTYRRLANSVKNRKNKDILNRIAADELKHYNILKKYTQSSPKPSSFLISKYYIISKLFGLTFGLKLMENGESSAQINYKAVSAFVPEAKTILLDEGRHEKDLINLLHEEKLKYVGSIVLGLNDALVELTGALAGLTLALRDSKIVATAGLITGLAASFSMAASEYLSTKSEKDGSRSAVKASVYTGIAYIFTVLFLILPYLILNNIYLSLAWTLTNAIIIIFIFTFYTSVARDERFSKNFLEMALISLGVAAISFGMGYLVRILFGIDV